MYGVALRQTGDPHAAADVSQAVFVVFLRRVGTIRPDATAWDVAMLMSGLCATMNQSAPGFDYRRHLELIIDALRPRC